MPLWKKKKEEHDIKHADVSRRREPTRSRWYKTSKHPAKKPESTPRPKKPQKTWSLPVRLKPKRKHRDDGRGRRREETRKAPRAASSRGLRRAEPIRRREEGKKAPHATSLRDPRRPEAARRREETRKVSHATRDHRRAEAARTHHIPSAWKHKHDPGRMRKTTRTSAFRDPRRLEGTRSHHVLRAWSGRHDGRRARKVEKRVRFRKKDVDFVAGRDNKEWRQKILRRTAREREAFLKELERGSRRHSHGSCGHRLW